jgi:hypothetical protein
MGQDLSLLPVEGHAPWRKCERRPGRFAALSALESQHGAPVPAGFKHLRRWPATPRCKTTPPTAPSGPIWRSCRRQQPVALFWP